MEPQILHADQPFSGLMVQANALIFFFQSFFALISGSGTYSRLLSLQAPTHCLSVPTFSSLVDRKSILGPLGALLYLQVTLSFQKVQGIQRSVLLLKHGSWVKCYRQAPLFQTPSVQHIRGGDPLLPSVTRVGSRNHSNSHRPRTHDWWQLPFYII